MLANAFALLLAVPLVAQLVVADCTRTYTVQEGDICDKISAAQNVSTYQLAVVNENIISPECDNLSPGQNICLGWPGEDCTQTHTVALGDDCDSVASAYGINATTLWTNNPQLDSDCGNLYVGEVVCIDSNAAAPPLPGSGSMPATAIPATATPASTDLPYC